MNIPPNPSGGYLPANGGGRFDGRYGAALPRYQTPGKAGGLPRVTVHVRPRVEGDLAAAPLHPTSTGPAAAIFRSVFRP